MELVSIDLTKQYTIPENLTPNRQTGMENTICKADPI